MRDRAEGRRPSGVVSLSIPGVSACQVRGDNRVKPRREGRSQPRAFPRNPNQPLELSHNPHPASFRCDVRGLRASSFPRLSAQGSVRALAHPSLTTTKKVVEAHMPFCTRVDV